MSEDVDLVIAAQSGDREAFGPLAQRWFDRCWEVALRILRDRDLAADVAQDTLLVAWQQLDRLQQPASFGGWVLRIARNRALDRLAKERRAVPVADHDQLEPAVSAARDTGPAEAFARGQEQDLVWAAAGALGERDASLLDLHLRHGLEPAELADELGITANAAHQALFRLRRRLGQTVRAWLLWRHQEPTCVVLRAELAAAGDAAFGADTVRLVRRHVATCDACADEHDRVATPAALFAAAPLIAAPALLRTNALASLAEAGVPVGDGVSGHGPDAPGQDGAGSDGAGQDGAGHDGAGTGGEGPNNQDAWHRGDGGENPQHIRQGHSRHDETIVSRADPNPTMMLPRTGQAPPPHTPRPRSAGLVATTLTMAVVLTIGGWLWWRTSPDAAVDVSDDPIATEIETAVPVAAPTPDPPHQIVAPPEPPPPPPPPPVVSETPSPPPPTIASLLATPQHGRCPPAGSPQSSGVRGASPFEISWMSDAADTATLTDPDGGTTAVATTGSTSRCAFDGDVFTLTVQGPGGTAESTVTVRTVPIQ